MQSARKPEYAIIGGGITGLTLAIALHYRGLHVKLYEQAKQYGDIGAGVSFTPNAVQAMRLCHPAIETAFEKVCTHNRWASKRQVWFDFYNGQNRGSEQTPLFTVTNGLGQNDVHRAHFLDELARLLPSHLSSFGKTLQSYEMESTGRYSLAFADGFSASTDVILVCDGIKSRVRRLMFGEDQPCASPSFSFKHAFRALVSTKDAIAMGHGGHVLTFPIDHGNLLNIVAFHTTKEPWENCNQTTAPSTREEMLRTFSHFGSEVLNLLGLASPQLDIWAIFDLGDNPPPNFSTGRVCLLGDAAHAASPHHGAGAGFCIEDAAVLSCLLSNELTTSPAIAEIALQVFDATRRQRGAWLVQSSQYIGNAYEWLIPEIGNDFGKIEEEIRRRNAVITDVNVEAMCNEAQLKFSKRCEMIIWKKEDRT